MKRPSAAADGDITVPPHATYSTATARVSSRVRRSGCNTLALPRTLAVPAGGGFRRSLCYPVLAQEAMADAMADDGPSSPAGVPEDPAHELWRNCRGSPGIFDHWMKLITHLEAAGEPVQPGTNSQKSSMQ